jgi:tRNA threonylcarbamoyl adenosine modification protein (Sua5/YciO/YrdC/YwlC family)
MIRLPVHPENPHRRHILKAVEVLKEGKLIIYPTDTVYGIGCDLYNKHALETLYQLKKKSKFDPISVVVKDIRQASQYARISNFSYRILRRCLPGPYTFILPATREIPRIMLSKRKEVGIRIPDCNVSLHLIEEFSHPLVNTSVNMSADELLNDPDEIEARYQYDVDLMLDVGWLPDAEESTVVSLINDEVTILREGKGELERLFE